MRTIGLRQRAAELRDRMGPRPRSRGRGGFLGGSGLARAARIRAAQGLDEPSSSGIGPDDRREIEDEIEGVSRRNRISARPEDFVVRPKRRGFVFPLAVNLLAIALTVAAIYVLSNVFLQRDIDIASSAASLETAEGKLLRELKRDSESRLLEKDRAIADFQARIREIDRERDALASSLDERLRSREAFLREALRREIEIERARLAGEPLSASAAETRLKAYESEKSAALDLLLARERQEAEAEKAAAEDRYRRLEADYQASIATLGEERRRLQDESARRESEIRAQAEAAARELKDQGAAAIAGLERAKAQLAELERQRSLQSSAEERVLGLYDSIQAALADRRYADAVAGADALVSYLGESESASNPLIKERRNVDLFVARTLGSFARDELARSSADAGRLLDQAAILEAARSDAAEARAALGEGDEERAREKFGEALARVPEILAAHEYFLDRAAAEEAARRARLADHLAAADRAYRAGDLARMSASYSGALEYLPISASARRELIARLERPAPPTAPPSAASGPPGEIPGADAAADTRNARPLAAEASRRLAAGDWAGAIAEYVGLLSAFPAAGQAGEALAGISTASEGLRRSAETSAESLSAARGEIEAAKRELEAGRQAASGLEAEIDSLRRLLDEERAGTAAAAARLDSTQAQAATAARDGEIDALRAEVARLSSLATRSERLSESYAAYRAAESTAAVEGSEDLVEASMRLDAFLGSEEARAALPGLRESVARYERAYQSAGQREVLYNALDLLEGAMRVNDAAARERYFAGLESRYAGDGTMLDFIAGLRRNLR